MSKKRSIFLTVLLAVSLLFNIFFVGTYVITRHSLKKLKTSQGRIELIARRLKLSDGQKEIFSEKLKSLREKAAEIKKSNSIQIDAFWQELAKDNPDPQKLKALTEITSSSRKEFTALAVESLRDFLGSLNPEQRKAYINFIRKKMDIFTETR